MALFAHKNPICFLDKPLCTHGCLQVMCFPVFPTHTWTCTVRVLYSQGDGCIRPHMHLGLRYELVLRVWECGRRRPLACQYVLMLHIWFPNFPLSLSALPSAPSTEMSGHCFVFSGWWRGCQMSDGPECRTSHPPYPFLSLVHSFLLLFLVFSGVLTRA